MELGLSADPGPATMRAVPGSVGVSSAESGVEPLCRAPQVIAGQFAILPRLLSHKLPYSTHWTAVRQFGRFFARRCEHLVANAAIPFESDHPYANNTECTWTFDNGSPNFQFHFSLLNVEAGFDYVDILDADGTVLESITGTYRNGYTSVVIPTSVGKVRLRTDGLLTRRGFIVDVVIQ